MASAFVKWLTDPRRNWFAAQHYKALSKRLKRYGLRYEDLYDPLYDLDIKEALNRLPREVVDARNQRLKRAIDLSMKHEYLPEDLQALQTPFRSYLKDMLALDWEPISPQQRHGSSIVEVYRIIEEALLVFLSGCKAGSFLGVSLEGNVVVTHLDANTRFYGDPYLTTTSRDNRSKQKLLYLCTLHWTIYFLRLMVYVCVYKWI